MHCDACACMELFCLALWYETPIKHYHMLTQPRLCDQAAKSSVAMSRSPPASKEAAGATAAGGNKVA